MSSRCCSGIWKKSTYTKWVCFWYSIRWMCLLDLFFPHFIIISRLESFISPRNFDLFTINHVLPCIRDKQWRLYSIEWSNRLQKFFPCSVNLYLPSTSLSISCQFSNPSSSGLLWCLGLEISSTINSRWSLPQFLLRY